jgi:hypothetical protein
VHNIVVNLGRRFCNPTPEGGVRSQIHHKQRGDNRLSNGHVYNIGTSNGSFTPDRPSLKRNSGPFIQTQLRLVSVIRAKTVSADGFVNRRKQVARRFQMTVRTPLPAETKRRFLHQRTEPQCASAAARTTPGKSRKDCDWQNQVWTGSPPSESDAITRTSASRRPFGNSYLAIGAPLFASVQSVSLL